MKKLLVILSIMATGLLVFGLMSMSVGCEEEEDVVTTTPDPKQDTGGTTPTDNELYAVMITDIGGSSDERYPGADMDAVEVLDATNASWWADAIYDSSIGEATTNLNMDDLAALGAYDTPDTMPAGGWGNTFVSLGGGYIIVAFEALVGGILPDDLITVYEVAGGSPGEEACLVTLCCDDYCDTGVDMAEGEGMFDNLVYESDWESCQ